MLNKAAGIKLTYIPFGGTGSAVPALLGGHVTALMTYSTMAIQYRRQVPGARHRLGQADGGPARRADLQGTGI